MNNEEIHSKEILSRLESEQWSQSIAKNVSIRYERNQTRNRILISTTAFIILGMAVGIAFFSPIELLNPSLVDLDLYNLFFSDELSPIYETVYREEGMSSLLEPISYLIE
ncbi:MAG: hypothetical protein KBF99_00710 [Leptospiraceae bacterium]|nr:hypothetical protein [Leptospiraceae bacterium]MBK7054084.1 hypothetical protein [Leptospiraceae bacterium]MBK9499794.1 hypothetical protein [Leptospiraceae bacterium]MBL0262456.1 hypothetical protein [Leptospiraceae bacterium]MBP9161663.1 hypothetical protein [Leptospiraceae bacterium]